MMTQKNMKKQVEKQVDEKKEKKVKPGAQKQRSKEEIVRALEEKKKTKETTQQRREREKFEAEYTQMRRFVGAGWCSNEKHLETIEEYRARLDAEELTRKEQWEAAHKEDALRVQKEQEKNRLLPKEMTEKKFKALIKSVGWNPTKAEMDAVLDQLSGYFLNKLWCETPLWFRARERGLIHDIQFLSGFLKGCGVTEKMKVHCEPEFSGRSANTAVMAKVNRMGK
jgi:hypothetical protein